MPSISKKLFGFFILMGALLLSVSLGIHASRYAGGRAVLPEGFVFLTDIDPSIHQDMRYAGSNNFIGSPITGYLAPVCIITERAARALAAIQRELERQGLSLLVYDCYRPQRAVNHFVRWSQDETDQMNKPQYYPRVDKRDFFRKGYVMQHSGHTRGSTVDLTIVNATTGAPLDMGTHFDFMDMLSHPANRQITRKQYQNRQLLRRLMFQHGFVGIATEWWHFTLQQEPYPETYFDFPVTARLSVHDLAVKLAENIEGVIGRVG